MTKIVVALLAGTFFTVASAKADFLDRLGALEKRVTGTNQANGSLAVPLSQAQMVQALKEALSAGLERGIAKLGATNGFLTNINVRIPMPQKLRSVEKTLRSLHQDQFVDDFVATMNHAAEQAVPGAAHVFANSLQQMSITDAENILTGPTNAATEFFRRTTETNLYQQFLPIVKSATTSNRVTEAYKNLMAKVTQGKLGGLGNLGDSSGALGGIFKQGSDYLNQNTVDLDDYITRGALNGLFKMVADEEKKIRENPAARTTELLQKVFGAIKK